MPEISYPRRPGTVHDQVFKDLAGAFLPELVALVAPEPAAHLDFSRWDILNKEIFTDWPKGRRRELDLLAKVERKAAGGRKALVHVEVEAEYRRKLGRRLSSYSMQIRLRHDLPVLSIALCLRGGPPGVALRSEEEDELGTELSRFRYYLFCLERSRAEDYLDRTEPLAWALAALMRPESLSPAEHKWACLRRINAAPLNELSRFLLANCVETYLQLEGHDAEELEALQARGNAEEVREMSTRRLTWAEQFEEKGWYKGVEKGLSQGIRQTLLHQLGVRFGPLSEDVKRRVESISSVEHLNQIAEQILVARSLEEMGLQ